MAEGRVSKELLLLLLLLELDDLLRQLEAMLARLEAAGRIEVCREDSQGCNGLIRQALDQLGAEHGLES